MNQGVIHVGILGGSGYGAGELLRLLTRHAHAEVVSVTTTSQAGERIDRVHPHLRGFYDLCLSERIDVDLLLDGEHAVVFSAMPHGASTAAIQRLMREAEASGGDRLKVIDLSGDFRLADRMAHESHYPDSPWLPELRTNFVYGLPELFRDRIRAARCIANPGCLATAATLAAAPLCAAGFSGAIVVDAKTGSSGSGRQLKKTTHHPTRHADFRAYKPLAHQHEPEILQAWSDAWGRARGETGGWAASNAAHGERIALSFLAQSMDVTRGIFATAHLTLDEATTVAMMGRPSAAVLSTEALAERYRSFYAGAPFVRIVEGTPTLQDVVGSNFCDIAIASRGRQVIAMAAIDNLVKGMAGTAIQNMNLMCGLEETEGLWFPSTRPV